jgi:hypothetical protein
MATSPRDRIAGHRRRSREPRDFSHSGVPAVEEHHRSRHGVRRWVTALLAGLGALGVLGAIGSYYVPGILDRLGSAATGRVPLDYDLILDRTETPNYVFPDAVNPAEFPAQTVYNGENADQWARQHHGVLADEQNVRLILRGRAASVIHIDDLRVVAVNRTTPRAGWYNGYDGCGAAVDPRVMKASLDKDPPTATWYVDGQQVDRPAFTVTGGNEEVFDVQAFTTRDEVNWVIEVVYSSADGSGVLRIDNHGTPFTVTTVTHAKAYTDYDGSRLVRTPDRDGPALIAQDHPVC